LERIAVGRMISAFSERRKRARASLRWIARLRRPSSDEELIEVYTVNVSSDGLYCVSPVPFHPGETLECFLEIPALTDHHEARTLRCLVLVVRLEHLDEGRCGIALHIQDYSVNAPGLV
jgi:hypothetical protein